MGQSGEQPSSADEGRHSLDPQNDVVKRSVADARLRYKAVKQ